MCNDEGMVMGFGEKCISKHDPAVYFILLACLLLLSLPTLCVSDRKIYEDYKGGARITNFFLHNLVVKLSIIIINYK